MGFLYSCSTLTHAVDLVEGQGFHYLLISLCQVVLPLPAPSRSHSQGHRNPEQGFWLLKKLSWTQMDFPGKGIWCLGVSQGSFTVFS